MFQDLEFQQLNPEFVGTAPQVPPPTDGYLEIPTVVSGQTDTTWTVTSWIDANSDAKAFLGGAFDPYGMHSTRTTRACSTRTTDFVGQDAFPLIQHLYNPVFPLATVATDQVENWPPGQ